jgi:H/ACA ribonucleoprotein complex subunit 2
MADASMAVEGGDKKEKKEKDEFHVPIDAIAPIAAPLAGKKLSKKLFKTVKKGSSLLPPATTSLCAVGGNLTCLFVCLVGMTDLASKARQLKRGVKEVVKALRKGEKGLLLLASNITPIDILSHLPLMAEEAGVKYVWVLAKYVASFQTPITSSQTLSFSLRIYSSCCVCW